MSRQLTHCPVCASEVVRAAYLFDQDTYLVECPACGHYAIVDFLVEMETFTHDASWWNTARRAALAHYIRHRRNIPLWPTAKCPLITSDVVKGFEESDIRLPSRLAQMDNLIRSLGDLEVQEGEPPFESRDGLWAEVGAASEESLANLALDTMASGYLAPGATKEPVGDGRWSVLNARLSIEGWKRWEQLKVGETRSRDGFIAMQFGVARLDEFVRNVVQVGVRQRLGVEVHRVDSPDKVQAGLIDNIMREAIEDAAFVLVELSHGNRGAYWEAGFAEGLRKPVIYLCEKAIWDDKDHPNRPHFDVNHRTTIMWDENEPDQFIEALVATIKNSLRNKTN